MADNEQPGSPVPEQEEEEVPAPTLDDYEVVDDHEASVGGVTGNEEEDGEDLLNDDYLQDYRPMGHLDEYEQAGIDNEYQESMGYEEALAARMAAEEAMDREGGRGRRKRQPDAFDDIEELDIHGARRRRMAANEDEDEPADEGLRQEIDKYDCKASKWIEENEPVQREAKRRFRNFLRRFKDDKGDLIYVQAIERMVTENRQSLELNYRHLVAREDCNILAVWIADAPRSMETLLNAAAREVVEDMFPEYYKIQSEIFVRHTNLPVDDKIRELRTWHLGNLIKVRGVVTRRTGVFPQLRMVHYDCASCGFVMGPFAQNGDKEVRPAQCAQCQSKGPFNVNAQETVYQNYQKLTLQESPGTVPAGRLPRHKEVVLLHDLIDCARPGEEVEVTGIYTSVYDPYLNVRNGFPVFSTHIEANWVSKNADLFSIYKLTDEDKMEIASLAADPRIGQRIVKSIAPSIYGHDNIKTNIALALFGGVEKHPSNSHRLRGDINCLLLGDPGTAKSQFLKYVEKTAMRAVYTTGKGASAVGLTASVHKDAITKEWTLEGGALVLADRGVCLIDEFDKMNDQDRVSIHEAMEQQTISISKAGIVTQLQARCSVIAAANPNGGRYDPSKTFSENVELTDPILSRFDVLCVVRDLVDPVQDKRLAQFVVSSHAASHPDLAAGPSADDGIVPPAAGAAAGPEPDGELLSQEMLRKYITYAKQHCRPQINQGEYDDLLRVYAELRAEAYKTHGMPVAVRHLESMIRMAEAHARMHLREFVTHADIQVAIKAMVESFIATQKYSLQRELSKRLRAYVVLPTDFFPVLLHLLRDLVRSEKRALQLTGEYDEGAGVAVSIRSLEEKAREYNITDLPAFYSSRDFRNNGFMLERDAGRIVLTDG